MRVGMLFFILPLSRRFLHPNALVGEDLTDGVTGLFGAIGLPLVRETELPAGITRPGLVVAPATGTERAGADPHAGIDPSVSPGPSYSNREGGCRSSCSDRASPGLTGVPAALANPDLRRGARCVLRRASFLARRPPRSPVGVE